MLEVLRKIYDAKNIANELTGERPAAPTASR
jgi:hypothetical protein